jgi:hypothetical protein
VSFIGCVMPHGQPCTACLRAMPDSGTHCGCVDITWGDALDTSQAFPPVQAFLAARKGANKRRGSPSSVLSLAGSPNNSVGSDASAPSSSARGGSDAASVPNYAEVRQPDDSPFGDGCTMISSGGNHSEI